MRSIFICFLLLGLAGCAAQGVPAARSAMASPDGAVPPFSTSTITLPNGNTIKCTSYPGAICPFTY